MPDFTAPRIRLAGGLVLALVAAGRAPAGVTHKDTADLGVTTNPGQLSGLTPLGPADWRLIADARNDLWTLNAPIHPATGMFAATPSIAKQTLGGAVRDYEGIAHAAAAGTLLVVEEDTPALRQFSLQTLNESPGSPLSVPAIFANRRGNLGFESLTLSPDGAAAFVANEEALTVDGPEATAGNSTVVRIQPYAATGGVFTPTPQQFAYTVDAVHGPNGPGVATDPQSGLVELVALPSGNLLALERSVFWTSLLGFTVPNFQSRLYLVDLASTSPIPDPALGLLDPANAGYVPLGKQLLLLGSFENLEGLALGAPTANGWTLLGVTDNNDEPSGLLPSRLLAFEITADLVPEPASAALLAGAGLALLSRRRRRR